MTLGWGTREDDLRAIRAGWDPLSGEEQSAFMHRRIDADRGMARPELLTQSHRERILVDPQGRVELSDADIERIARRVVELLGEANGGDKSAEESWRPLHHLSLRDVNAYRDAGRRTEADERQHPHERAYGRRRAELAEEEIRRRVECDDRRPTD